MRKSLFLLAIALFFTGIAGSTTLEEENVTVDLEDNSVNLDLSVTDLTSSEFTYLTNHQVEDYSVEIDSEPVDCRFEETRLGGEFQCPTELDDFDVEISYTNTDFVNDQNGIKDFRYSQSIYRPVNEHNFKVILPEGAGVLDQSNLSTPVINPESGEIGSEGRRIHVEWSQEPSIGDTLSFEVYYEDLSPSYSYLVVLAVMALAVMGGVKFYLSRRASTEDSVDLTEYEREVVDMLEEGSMLQKDIVNESEYSKAKISGVVSSLEEKGLVTKDKEGRSNRVELK